MFQPEALRDRMKWIMEYDLLGDIRDQMVEEKQPVTKENTQAVKVVA
jgi:hypothetical protein